jgi:hypothetical protein
MLREFIKTGENIVKIGKTHQENLKRFVSYPKGSVIHVHYKCMYMLCDAMEKIIMNLFKEKYKQRTDIGTEYFEGNVNNMKRTFIEIIQKYDVEYSESEINHNERGECEREKELIEKEREEREREAIEEEREEQKREKEAIEEYENTLVHNMEEFFSNSRIKDIVITNRDEAQGILNFGGNSWFRFSDDSDESLEGWLENYCEFEIQDLEAVKKEIVTKKYKNIVPYIPSYNITYVRHGFLVYEFDFLNRKISLLMDIQKNDKKDMYIIMYSTIYHFPIREINSYMDNDINSYKLSLVNKLIKSYITDEKYIEDFKRVCKAIFCHKEKCSIIDIGWKNVSSYTFSSLICGLCNIFFKGSICYVHKDNPKVPKKDMDKLILVVVEDISRKSYISKLNLNCPVIYHEEKYRNIYNYPRLLSTINENLDAFPKYKENQTTIDVKRIFENDLRLDVLWWATS